MKKLLAKPFYLLLRLFCLPCKMVAGAIRTQELNEDAPLREQMQKQRAEHAKNLNYDYSHAFRYIYILRFVIYQK